MTTSLLISLSLLVSSPTPTTLDEDACIQRVLEKHADLRVADLQIESARTKLKELESTFYPKLQVTTWVAPMFRVNGNALEPTVDYEYESLSDWGPYLHFEARLVQLLSTFGRFDTVKEAAELNTKVEEAKRQLVETSLLTETRRLVLAYRLALSLEKTVGTILETLDKALDYAKPAYAAGTGAVTTIDLSRLEFGKSKALGFQAMLEEQTQLVEQGLRFLLHAHDHEELQFSFEKLPRLRSIEALPNTDTLIERAHRGRPEWSQLRNGQKVYQNLAEVERQNLYLPYLFLAGEFSADWTPMRDNSENPYHFDPYNGTWGGLALGLRWDLDWAGSAARREGWELERNKLEALEIKLASGIEAEILALVTQVNQAKKRGDIIRLGGRAARKWMLSASAGFSLGTASARDLLEGVLAFSEAKLGEASATYALLVARAELDRALGFRIESDRE